MTRTLHVRIGSSSDRNDLEDTLATLDADGTEAVDPKPSTLTVDDLETFGRIFRPTNLELLEAIANHEPESIRELARLVDRHPPEVTQNVTELSDYGLVELEPNGRAKRPTIWYDEIDVDIPLGKHSPDVAPA
ncbi:HVO_A0114 family putative DNA-binding protein [Halopiger goleimassiliensis]|uniref:HVO_A0114 family putative DNA-binding protein n=1 Tax=Halopiger goleimassiliensis TaxID=1293048 RepID=UPI000677F223|nr:MarR family transcriptional regulator [Halopiger goleimassiliensis]